MSQYFGLDPLRIFYYWLNISKNVWLRFHLWKNTIRRLFTTIPNFDIRVVSFMGFRCFGHNKHFPQCWIHSIIPHQITKKITCFLIFFSQTLLPDFSTQPHPTTRLRIPCLKRSLQVQETPRHTTTTLPWIIRWTTKTTLQTIWSVLRPRYIRIKIE